MPQPSLVQQCRLTVKHTHIDAIADNQRYRLPFDNYQLKSLQIVSAHTVACYGDFMPQCGLRRDWRHWCVLLDNCAPLIWRGFTKRLFHYRIKYYLNSTRKLSIAGVYYQSVHPGKRPTIRPVRNDIHIFMEMTFSQLSVRNWVDYGACVNGAGKDLQRVISSRVCWHIAAERARTCGTLLAAECVVRSDYGKT